MKIVDFLSCCGLALGGAVLSIHLLGIHDNFSILSEKIKDMNGNTVIVNVGKEADSQEKSVLWRNNPGNVKRLSSDTWEGQIGVDKQGHVIFSHKNYGIRAMALTLINFQRKHKLKTLETMIDRYCESNKQEYVTFLSKKLGINPKEEFDVKKVLPEMVMAMTTFETGNKNLVSEEDVILLSLYNNL